MFWRSFIIAVFMCHKNSVLAQGHNIYRAKTNCLIKLKYHNTLDTSIF